MEGVAWHGPAVLEILSDVDAVKAGNRSINNIHTIAELTGHITTWHRAVLRRLNDEVYEPTEDENWPVYERIDDNQWQVLKNELEASFRDLYRKMEILDDNALENPVPGKNYNMYYMLHGVIQHDLYHAGQMAILKKAGKRQ